MYQELREHNVVLICRQMGANVEVAKKMLSVGSSICVSFPKSLQACKSALQPVVLPCPYYQQSHLLNFFLNQHFSSTFFVIFNQMGHSVTQWVFVILLQQVLFVHLFFNR